MDPCWATISILSQRSRSRDLDRDINMHVELTYHWSSDQINTMVLLNLFTRRATWNAPTLLHSTLFINDAHYTRKGEELVISSTSS